MRNPDYYHKGQPYLDGIDGIFADKQSVRVDALRGDRAAIEFRGLPPSARDQLIKERATRSPCRTATGTAATSSPPTTRRSRSTTSACARALALAVDQWKGAPALAKIATVRTVGGIVFPGSPLAATKEELQQIAGYWPDIEKSRAEAKRLLKEAGAEDLKFELTQPQRRPALQVRRHLADRRMEEDRRQRRAEGRADRPVVLQAMRGGTFDVVVEANCQSVVNPVLDTGKYLPHKVYPENYGDYDDPKSIELYEKMQLETDPQAQRAAMRAYEKHTLDTEAHEIVMPYWYRIVMARSYVKGWKISPSHYLNQDLANIWLDK